MANRRYFSDLNLGEKWKDCIRMIHESQPPAPSEDNAQSFTDAEPIPNGSEQVESPVRQPVSASSLRQPR